MQQILKDVKLPERRDLDIAPKPAAPAPTVPDALKDIDAPATETAPDTDAPAADTIQTVHTLKHDLQNVVQTQKISLVRAAALEQGKQRPEAIVEQRPQSHIFRTMMVAALLLLILGGAALFGVYVVVQSKSAPLETPKSDSIVFAERTVALPISGQSAAVLKQTLAAARTSGGGSLGSITRVQPVVAVATSLDAQSTTRAATLAEFFKALGITPPDALMRSVTDQFFFGFHTVDKNAPIFVIKVSSYTHAFAAMLEWENTMNADLAPVFISVPPLVLGADGLPTERTFTDVVMRNYDVRALKDDQGAVQLYYSFPTRDTLIIAESPYTFTELLSRLQAVRTL